MPLAIQALLPFLLLTGGAAAASLPALRRHGGAIAALAAAGAAGVALTLLLRLAPAIRVDALAMAFGLSLLVTACLLILARLLSDDDRRRPWSSWLLTTAAALGVIFAGSLVLVYALLRLCTLAWSGALDEAAPRGRGLRTAEQIADLGLLVAAALAAAGVGTTAFSGLPSDALGPGIFLLALLPVGVRIAALAAAAERPRTPVLFHPAIAQATLAGYLLLRLIAVAGGRPPGRELQVLVFAAGLALAALVSIQAWRARSSGTARLRLAAAQAGIAIALCALGTSVAAVAGVWAWLGVVALTALASIRQTPGSLGALLTTAAQTILPPGFLFVGLWLGTVSLVQRQLEAALIPLWLAAGLAAAAALRHARWPAGEPRGLLSPAPVPLAAGLLLLGGALPLAILPWLVIPAARILRGIPGGTVGWGLLGITAGPTAVPTQSLPRLGSAGSASSRTSAATACPCAGPSIPPGPECVRRPLSSASIGLTWRAGGRFPGPAPPGSPMPRWWSTPSSGSEGEAVTTLAPVIAFVAGFLLAELREGWVRLAGLWAMIGATGAGLALTTSRPEEAAWAVGPMLASALGGMKEIVLERKTGRLLEPTEFHTWRLLHTPPQPYTRERFEDTYQWTVKWNMTVPGATYENTVDNRAWG